MQKTRWYLRICTDNITYNGYIENSEKQEQIVNQIMSKQYIKLCTGNDIPVYINSSKIVSVEISSYTFPQIKDISDKR